MKFGVCRGLDDLQSMQAAKSAGADYFETGFGCLADFTDEKFLQGKKMLDSLELKCLAANSFIPGNISLVGDNVDYCAIEDYLDRGFERAGIIGIEKIVLGSGRARSFPEGFSRDKAEEQLAYFLGEYAAPRAEKINAIIVLEPLRFGESSMLHTVADGVRIAGLSGAKNVFALADLYHVYGNNDSIAQMTQFNGLVRHSHIAEPINRRYPFATDNESVLYIYREFLNALKLAGCDTCSIEAHTDDFEGDVKSSLAFLKSL